MSRKRISSLDCPRCGNKVIKKYNGLGPKSVAINGDHVIRYNDRVWHQSCRVYTVQENKIRRDRKLDKRCKPSIKIPKFSSNPKANGGVVLGRAEIRRRYYLRNREKILAKRKEKYLKKKIECVYEF